MFPKLKINLFNPLNFINLENAMKKRLLFCALVSLAASPAFAQDFSHLYTQLNPSVVTILTREVVGSDQGIGEQESLGSGVLIDVKGLVMTAAHVVNTADAILVKMANGEYIPGEVVSSVPAADVALVKVARPAKNPVVAALGNSDSVKTGEQVFIIGAPFGLEHSLTTGHVSGKVTKEMIAGGQMIQFIQTDAAINTGNSGGPIFNMKGEVIGIVSHILSRSGGYDGIGFAVAINPARGILLEAPPFWTGFEGMYLNKEAARIFNIAQPGAVLVQRVVEGSLAGKAGLHGGTLKATILGKEFWVGGDVILSIENITCTNPHNFAAMRTAVQKLQPGQTIVMRILRGGQVMELLMTL